MYILILILFYNFFAAELDSIRGALINDMVSKRKADDLFKYLKKTDDEELYYAAFNLLAFYGQDDLIGDYLDQFKEKINLAKLDKNGLTALHYAVYNGSVSVARTLISKGFPTDIQDSKGQGFVDFVSKNCRSPLFLETLAISLPNLKLNSK